jgi:uncharacterized repeat protein (TIGR01451 family)
MTIVFVLTGVLLLGATQTAYADGTASGTPIGNRATIDYSVNGIEQTKIESSPSGNSTAGIGNGNNTTFVVDNKVDLIVTTMDSAPGVEVTPGDTAVLTFLVTNEGNTVQDYDLDANAVVTGGATNFGGAVTDGFDMSSVSIYVDSNDNGTYEPTDTATFIDELAADANVYAFIVATAPLSATNGQYASYHLTATTHDGGSPEIKGSVTLNTSGNVDDPNFVQVVFADGTGSLDGPSRDGKHSAHDDYKCSSSVLIITKTSDVIYDPINGESDYAKRIPGAIVEYTVTVTNDPGAAKPATGIKVSDSLDVEIDANTIEFHTDGYASGYGIQVDAPNIPGSPKNLSNSSGNDEGDFGYTAANTVTVTGIALDVGQSATVKFKVIIK